MITGLDYFDGKENEFCFHAGTAFGADGSVVTNGGRVLGITAVGADLKSARSLAYEASGHVSFEGAMKRSDIGKAIDEA